ncbi:mevalonate kinase [Pontiella sp.]|uniref:mevalonate kinase family protein n=1 Tax=Pontiella sp. TaxID=2837462 RepID=UPI0035628D68
MANDACIKTSAPGSLMLLGEHAVLHGHKALVGAISRRMTVKLKPSDDDSVRIVSALGQYKAPLNDLVDHPSLGFVLQAIRQQFPFIPTGFELSIDSDFSADIGFGSSAAVTVATHAALLRWITGKPPAPEKLFKQAVETVRSVQGRGSGADVAASVFGGMVGYEIPPTFQPVGLSIPLTAVYCGYKTPTPEVIRRVEQLRSADPEKYRKIDAEIDAGVADAIGCLKRRDFPAFGKILNRHQQLMDQMGVNTPELAEIVSALQASPDVFGAKISGSGLGDCAIGAGYADLAGLDYPVYHLEITPAGCRYHE